MMHKDVTIYFIRHGETDWNNAGRLQGQLDIPLNETGRTQATTNGKNLSEHIGGQLYRFRFVSSPLSRARETMERIRAAMGVDRGAYETDSALLERCLGDWEGKTLDELPIHLPKHITEPEQANLHDAPPGKNSESYAEMSLRISIWLEKISTPTVCVTHGGVIKHVLNLVSSSNEKEILNQPIHQDRILRYANRQFEWLKADSGRYNS